MRVLNIRLRRMIWKYKGQFLAVTAVVIIGLMIYTGTSMAVRNLDTTLNNYYEQTNFADIFVELVKIPESAIEDIEKLDFINKAEGRLVFDLPLQTGNSDEKVKIRMISYDFEKQRINKHFLIDGSLDSKTNYGVYPVQMFANARDIKIGDVIRTQIFGDQYNLTVEGVVANPEYIYLMENEQSLLPDHEKFGVLFVNKNFAQNSFGYSNSYNQVIVKLKEEINPQFAKKELEKILDKYGVKRVYKRKDQLSNRMVHEEIEAGKKASKTVPLIFLGVGAVIISIMIQRIVKNDRVTIGVFKALGYSNIEIVFHYTLISLSIGFFGSIFGILFGTFFSNKMAEMYVDMIFNIPILYGEIYYEYYLFTILMASVFCVAAGLLGAKSVISTLPAESMSPETPKKGKRIFLESWKSFWSKVSFSWKIVIRNIFRSKKRFLFITLGISLTFCVTVIPIYQASAFKDIFVSHYSKFQTLDYTVKFSAPQNKNIIPKISEIIDAKLIEPISEYPFEVKNGWKNKVVNVIGLSRDTKLYHFKGIKNEKIEIPDKGVLISKSLADILNVKKGDYVSLKSFIPERDDKEVYVAGVIKQKLGMNIYMDIKAMDNLLLDSELATGVIIKSDTDIKPALENLKGILSVQSVENMKNVFMEFLDLTMVTIIFLIIFSGILGFAVVYNSTVMSINERQLEFSTLRILGFSKPEIFNLILKENLIMTIFGLIIGIPMGIFMIGSIAKSFSTELYTLDLINSPKTFIQSIVLTIIFVILAQAATYNKIHKLNFIDALKNRSS